ARRDGAAPRRPASTSLAAGARTAIPARALRGMARRREGTGRRPALRWDSQPRRPRPRRSCAWRGSAERGPGRPEAHRRRKRRSRSREPRHDRPERSSRPRAVAPRPAWVSERLGSPAGAWAYRCSRLSFDLDEYRRRAEQFSEKLSREYYLHLAGHKLELEIEPIYRDFADLFAIRDVERLRELWGAATGDEERRRLRYLLQFAFDGLVGLETRSESAELAGLEASLE